MSAEAMTPTSGIAKAAVSMNLIIVSGRGRTTVKTDGGVDMGPEDHIAPT